MSLPSSNVAKKRLLSDIEEDVGKKDDGKFNLKPIDVGRIVGDILSTSNRDIDRAVDLTWSTTDTGINNMSIRIHFPKTTAEEQSHPETIVTPTTKHARTESAHVQPSNTVTHVMQQTQRSGQDEDHSIKNHDAKTKNVIDVTNESISDLIVAAIDASTETGVVKVDLAISEHDNSFIIFSVTADSVDIPCIYDCKKYVECGKVTLRLAADKSTRFVHQMIGCLRHVETFSSGAASDETSECTIDAGATVNGSKLLSWFECKYHKPTGTVKCTDAHVDVGEVKGTRVRFLIPTNIMVESWMLATSRVKRYAAEKMVKLVVILSPAVKTVIAEKRRNKSEKEGEKKTANVNAVSSAVQTVIADKRGAENKEKDGKLSINLNTPV